MAAADGVGVGHSYLDADDRARAPDDVPLTVP